VRRVPRRGIGGNPALEKGGDTMPTVKLITEEEATGRVLEIYDEIKKIYGMPFVPNAYKAMAI
jgi:hypothetical protein